MAQLRETDQLERRAKDIVERLHGVWRRGRGMCCCPAHEDRIPSLSVSLGRTAILFHCFAGCSSEAVMEALEQQGVRPTQLFDGATERPLMPVDRTDHARAAFRLWLSATSMLGSAAEGYLINRGIAARSSQLRYLHRTPLGAGNAVRFLPAMVAAVRTDALILAVHRTFLDPESSHLARFECPKRALGSLGQGAVRLAEPVDGKLGLAEGIESALSAMELFGIPCWASLGNERFGLVAIPDSVRELHLFIDNDAGGALAETRARAAYAAPGRVIVTHVPEGRGSDWNDELVATRAANRSLTGAEERGPSAD